MSSTYSGNYQLNLEPQKRNVFVTQLNEQQNFEDDDIRRFPVVKESSDHLLKTGVNTLQKTTLLRKAVEIKLIDEELSAKREEFRKRMAKNKTKEDALNKKQEKIKQRVTKFDKFLKENEAKRSRALQKYQHEVKENKIRLNELMEAKNEVEDLLAKKEALLKKLQHYKKYEEFMLRVTDAVPDDYIEMSGDNIIECVIQRYEGLAATHAGLLQRNKDRAAAIEAGQRQLESMNQERNQQMLLSNQELAELQKAHEELIQKNKRLEQSVSENAKNHRSFASELGRITMAINNLSETSHTKHWPPLQEMNYIAKLNLIKQHFLDQVQIQKLVQRLGETKLATSSSVKFASRPSQNRSKEDANASTAKLFSTSVSGKRKSSVMMTGPVGGKIGIASQKVTSISK